MKNTKIDIRCAITKQYKSSPITENIGLEDYYELIEKPIKEVLEVIASRLLSEKDNYMKFEIIITPTFSGAEFMDAIGRG